MGGRSGWGDRLRPSNWVILRKERAALVPVEAAAPLPARGGPAASGARSGEDAAAPRSKHGPSAEPASPGGHGVEIPGGHLPGAHPRAPTRTHTHPLRGARHREAAFRGQHVRDAPASARPGLPGPSTSRRRRRHPRSQPRGPCRERQGHAATRSPFRPGGLGGTSSRTPSRRGPQRALRQEGEFWVRAGAGPARKPKTQPRALPAGPSPRLPVGVPVRWPVHPDRPPAPRCCPRCQGPARAPPPASLRAPRSALADTHLVSPPPAPHARLHRGGPPAPARAPARLPTPCPSRGIRGRLRSAGTGSRPRPRPYRPWLPPAGPAPPALPPPLLLLPLRPPLPRAGRRGRAPGAGSGRPCCTAEAEAEAVAAAAAGGASLRCAERTRGPAPGAPAAANARRVLQPQGAPGRRRVGARGRSGSRGRAGPSRLGIRSRSPPPEPGASAAYWPRRVSGWGARACARRSSCACGGPGHAPAPGPSSPGSGPSPGPATAPKDARDSPTIRGRSGSSPG